MTSSHRVHDLAGNLTTPDWPTLTLAEIESLLAHYPGLGAVQSIDWHSPRPLSAAALIHTQDGTEIFIKRHASTVRSVADLLEEHALIEHLRANGLPLPGLYRDHGGMSAVSIAGANYELHAKAQGQDLYRDSQSWTPLRDLAHARAAGAMLARLHLAAASHTAPQRRTHLLIARGELIAAANPIAALEWELPQRPALAAYLAERPWRAELAPVFAARPADLPTRLATQSACWTHNDWHASNLCWVPSPGQASISAILDFGLSARTFALYDLATAIERNAIAWLELERGAVAVHTATALALVQGYSEVTPLDVAQHALLADILPWVHIDFALSELEYFNGQTRNRKAADVTYNDFLLGHAAWFAGRHGQALLKALRTGTCTA